MGSPLAWIGALAVVAGCATIGGIAGGILAERTGDPSRVFGMGLAGLMGGAAAGVGLAWMLT